ATWCIVRAADAESTEMEGARLAAGFYGWLAEFEHPEELVTAAARTKEAGYTKVEAYSPMPIHGLDEALRLGRPWMSQIVLGGAMCGLVLGFGLLYYITVIVYPHNSGGRPIFSWPSYIPVMFETTVLLGAIIGV